MLAKRRRTRRRLEAERRATADGFEELDYFDTSLRSASSALLAQVRITTPCASVGTRWWATTWSAIARAAATAIFDATMRTREAEALLQREGTELAQLRRRRDGRVVAGACPGSRGAVKIASALTFAAACAALVAHVDTVRSAG
ncbi:MAG: hypothetical protein R3B99_06160 [Polyangiales bacterium]